MKKILLTSILMGIMSVGIQAEISPKKIKLCEKKNDIGACFELAGIFGKHGSKEYNITKAYIYSTKVARSLETGCKKENTKACELLKKYYPIGIDELPGTFTVDGLHAGMLQGDVLHAKFTQKKDGTFDVMSGGENSMFTIMYGESPSGEYLEYSTKILERDAKVDLYLTQKSGRLYGVRVFWEGIPATGNTFKYFNKSLKDTLNEKYGKSRSMEKKELAKMLMTGQEWKPNDRAVIRLHMSIGADMSMSLILSYIDTELEKKHQKEMSAPKKTKAL